MGTVSGDPEVQVFMSLSAVGGKRWGCDKASGRPGRAARVLWANPELEAGGWARGE